MKLSAPLFAACLALTCSLATASVPTSVHTERTQAASLIALGRTAQATPTPTEQQTSGASIADLVAHHRQRLQSDEALRRETVVKAYVDAFGREPTASELTAGMKTPQTYTELMKAHIKTLAENPSDYEQLLERAYQRVIRRKVYPEEIAYWRQRDTLPYVLLVGCVENWGYRNAPGLMGTTGVPTVSVNSRYLSAVVLTPALAVEARQAAGLLPTGDAGLAIASGRNLIAAGGADIVTSGRMHLVVAGADNLLPSPVGS
jgi:hypothetical protein